jgi:hypothetical protein
MATRYFDIGIPDVKLRHLFALTGLALAGCAPAHVPWSNSALPQSQWSHDWSRCRHQAEDEVLGYGTDMDERKTPFDAYDRAQARKQVDGMVANCMINLGYLPVRKGN